MASPNIYTNTHMLKHTQPHTHSFGAFRTYGKQDGHYPDGADTGKSIWLVLPSHRRQMYLSCRYIWRGIPVASNA